MLVIFLLVTAHWFSASYEWAKSGMELVSCVDTRKSMACDMHYWIVGGNVD